MDRAKRGERLGEGGGWRAALKRFDERGLSVRAFCEREGLGAASLYQWRTRLSGELPPRETSTTKAGRTAPTPAGFLDLGTPSAKSPRLELRADLGAGMVMHLVRG